MLFDDLLAISLIQGVGEKTLNKACAYSLANELLAMSEDELCQIFPNRKTATLFATDFDTYKKLAFHIRTQMQNCSGYILHKDNSKYPQRLLKLPDHPTFLYCRGNIELLNNTAHGAISGPRKPSQAGLTISAQTAKDLTSRGIAVVSGLAAGIDTAAHQAAFSGGNTIAVLPFFAPVYPVQNTELAEKIIANGGLIIAPCYNQFNIKYQLLYRDKIIAALANTLYIPDAYASDSGTAFTVACAHKLGVPVYVFKNGKYIKNKT